MAIIGWDLDGVGYIFGESVRDFMKTEGRVVPPATDQFCDNFNFHERWGVYRPEFEEIVSRGVDAGIVFGPGRHLTRPGFFPALWAMKNEGHKNVIITHRYQGSAGNAERNTRLWLSPYMDFIDELHFNEDKTSVYTDFFIEDNVDNYDALTLAGTKAFLINRPWNAIDDARNRINTIEEYTKAIRTYCRSGYYDQALV